MGKIAVLFAIMVFLPAISPTSSANGAIVVGAALKQQLLGSPVHIQIFKEERMLELYAKLNGKYQLVDSYPICSFSGGLGPKQLKGDFKSPEGFYSVGIHHLKPDSKFYRAINIGFPNEYDKSKGYSGKYLMIHGECKSTGCYAMTNNYIDEIFRYVQTAFINGQHKVDINIYPFRMTDTNMRRHRLSVYYGFWRQLQPGYTWFAENRTPPLVSVTNGRYVINTMPFTQEKTSGYRLTKTK